MGSGQAAVSNRKIVDKLPSGPDLHLLSTRVVDDHP
jgi:hypothetical protein